MKNSKSTPKNEGKGDDQTRDEYGQVLVDDGGSDIDSPQPSPTNAQRQRMQSRKSFVASFYDASKSFMPSKSHFKMMVDSVVAATTLDDARIASPFQNWNRQQLVDILIRNGIQLRAESTIPTSSLRERADEFFKGQPIPKKPLPMSFDELARLEHVVLKVQNAWVETLERRRKMRQMQSDSRQYEQDLDDYDYAAALEAELNDPDTVEVEVEFDRGFDYDDSGIDVERGPEGEMPTSSDHQYTAINNIANNNRPPSYEAIIQPKRSSFGIVLDAVGKVLSPRSTETTTPPPKEKKTLSYTKSIHVAKKAVAFLDRMWEPPDFRKAEKYLSYFHPRRGGKGGLIYDYIRTTTGRHCCIGGFGEQCDLFQEGQMSEFAVYGPGVTNYFKFIKWCFGVFAALTVITMPCLVINFYGPYQYNSGLAELSMTTLGNLAPSTVNETSRLNIPGCFPYGGYHVDCTMSRTTLGEVYSWIDIIVVCLILIAYLWLKNFEVYEETHLDKNTLYASQYTIMVTNLPPTVTEEEIKHHFKDMANYSIAQCAIGYDNELEIELCRERGQMIRSKKNAIHNHRFFSTITRKKYADESNTAAGEEVIKNERIRFFREIRDIDNRIKTINRNLNAYSTKEAVPLVAFITYNDDIAAKVVVNKYNTMSYLRYYFGSHPFRMHTLKDNKRFLLGVYPAPEPSTIIWENLKYGTVDRILRRSVSTWLALLMVFLSVLVTLGAKYFTVNYYNDNGATNTGCPAGFSSYTTSGQLDYVEQYPDYAYCYCSKLTMLEQTRESVCGRYVRQRLSAQFFTFFSSFIVLVMNSLIELIINLTSKFEKHHSEDSRSESIFIRLFFLKYINTGAIFLIANNYDVLRTFFGIQSENASEFSPVWYNSIGVSILIVQMGNIFTGHFEKIYSYLRYRRRVALAIKEPKHALTQDDLNKKHLGPNFRIAFSYAQLLSTSFVCLTFSTGMPLLYAIAAANFFLFYLLEKYLFIHCYRTPPRWSSRLASQVSRLVPVACILHLCMSIWIITDPTSAKVFGNSVSAYSSKVKHSGSLRDRVTEGHTFRLFVFAVLIAVLIILWYIYQFILRFLGRFFKLACDCCSCFSSKNPLLEDDTSLVTYSRAIQRNLIKGLATYNLLQNPIYKEDFGITWKFAIDHAHVRSIRFDQGGNIDEEDDVDKAEKRIRNRNEEKGLSTSPSHVRGRFFGRNNSQQQKPKHKKKKVKNSAQNAPTNVSESYRTRQRILLEAGEDVSQV